MNITTSFIRDVLENGLTQDESNSFMWGNTPSEQTRLKRGILNLKDHATNEANPEADRETSNEEISPIIQTWLNNCNDVAAVEAMASKLWGLEI